MDICEVHEHLYAFEEQQRHFLSCTSQASLKQKKFRLNCVYSEVVWNLGCAPKKDNGRVMMFQRNWNGLVRFAFDCTTSLKFPHIISHRQKVWNSSSQRSQAAPLSAGSENLPLRRPDLNCSCPLASMVLRQEILQERISVDLRSWKFAWENQLFLQSCNSTLYARLL